ncbi:NF038104 family lipoprotein [Uruburuella suis]|uniref:NF038104 family lipoprotein n=1 Tax=Uruburuella suis TaxID=252130 RepID=A0AAE9KI30_9NEIS|nr:NF038104 family lipoprotein [Uruburuella suis]UOO80669.1 NF038104 family lipoprotein [Uruburuella suis]
MKSLRRTALPLATGLLLGGCVVASAVDLAATTVFTVGKIAVKTTGAVVDAVIPDGNDDKDKKESKSKARKAESLPPQPSAADYHPTTPVYQPAPANTDAVDIAQ